MDLYSMDVYTISLRCQEEMERFHRNEPREDRFCLELFRRAVVARSAAAWERICTLYYSLVRKWVLQETRDWQMVCEHDREALINGGFSRFWQYYTADKLEQSIGLGSVLAYLRTCVVSEVGQWKRQAERRRLEIPADEGMSSLPASGAEPERVVLRQMEAQELWAIVRDHCHDERDRIIAWLSFAADWGPGQIQSAHPQLFPDINDIYRRKRNLRDRLRRDERLIDR